jgi:hypothetical protein
MDPIEVMVAITNPDDFISWSQDRKISRYERVIEWHDYIADLHNRGNVPQVWGSHQLLSRADFVKSLGLLIAVYRVESWLEFDELLLNDPLRDISQYVTIPLSPLVEDQPVDNNRLVVKRNRLFLGQDNMGLVNLSNHRALFERQPEFVGQHQLTPPANAPIDLTATAQPGAPLQILIMGINPDELITHWNDARKVVHYEKVSWWFDYIAMMIQQGKVTHGWATRDFCNITTMDSGNRASSVVLYQVQDYDEFDELYTLDPLREEAMHWSVLLQPIADQRRMDEVRLAQARARS